MAGDGVVAAGFEYVDDVASGEDDDWVAVFADFLVGLGVDVGRGDQDAELAVPEPGDQAAGPADSDAVRWFVAFGFEGELDGHGVIGRAQEVVPDGVTAAVAPGPGHVDAVHMRFGQLPQVGGELLEVIGPVGEVPVDGVQQGHVGWGWQLLFPAADDDGGRGQQRGDTSRF